MTVKEIIEASGGGLAVLLTIIQVSKINWNPWSSLFRWIGNMFNAGVLDKVKDIEEDVKTMKEDIKQIKSADAEKDAFDSRYRILRFADEIYLGQNHSMEHYKQILTDVQNYENYCKINPAFPNCIAVSAIQVVKDTYQEKIMTHAFLERSAEQ